MPPEGPTTSRYLALANTLLLIATFAGTLTFTVLLTVVNPPAQVRILLGFASALFLGCITGLFPIILALQRWCDDESPQGVFYVIVTVGYSVITAIMSTAFILLVLVLKYYTVRSAFILGIILLGFSISATVFVAVWNALSWKWPTLVDAPQ